MKKNTQRDGQRCPYCQLNDMAAGRPVKEPNYPLMTKVDFAGHLMQEHLLDLKGAVSVWNGRHPAWTEKMD